MAGRWRLAPGSAALTVAVGLLAAAGCARSDRAPDVVLFVIDTLRADRVGAYGHSRPTTPHLDALAGESVVFERAYAPAPWTLPSVVSLLTSTFPCEHGVVLDGQRIAPSLVPLAERLKGAGYATASFYANPYAGPMTGLGRGVDHLEAVPFAEGSVVAPWLDRTRDRPLFLYVHNVEPHDPYEAPAEVVARFGSDASTQVRANRLVGRYRQLSRVDWGAGRPPGTTDNTAQQQAAAAELANLRPAVEALYDADVFEADRRLGSVIEALRARGRFDDTLLMVVADHGEEFGEHGAWQHDQSLYEELVRVPLVVRLPGGRSGGTRVATPVSLVDVVPTVAEVLSRPELARGARGRSLLGAEARSGKIPAISQRVNLKKYFRPLAELRGERNVAIVSGTWKGVWNQDPDTFELYDLAEDPGETRDLAGAAAERAASLRAEARAWLEQCAHGDPTTAPAGALDPETRERLRALGYVD